MSDVGNLLFLKTLILIYLHLNLFLLKLLLFICGRGCIRDAEPRT